MAKIFIENYQYKHCNINLTDIAKQLNDQGYKTRRGYDFTPTSIKRLLSK
jgi:hypothetical protein